MRKLPLLVSGLACLTPVALSALSPAQAWDIGPWVRGRNYSIGMPAQPSQAAGGGVMFDFPLAGRGQIDAMTTAVGPLAGARQITMHYRIDAAPGTRFIADESPNDAATVSLYFQQAGDNWSAKGRFGSYRWYVPARAVIPLAPGVQTVTIRFDEPWGNVNGVPSNQDPGGLCRRLGQREPHRNRVRLNRLAQPRRLRDGPCPVHPAGARYPVAQAVGRSTMCPTAVFEAGTW